MAGFSKIYCIGKAGGYLGSDGINRIQLQILVGDADRQWMECHYFDSSIKPIGNLKAIVPSSPDSPDSLLDACITFFPAHFVKCLSLKAIVDQLKDATRLDLNINEPSGWPRLRSEAKEAFASLGIWQAKLEQLRYDS